MLSPTFPLRATGLCNFPGPGACVRALKLERGVQGELWERGAPSTPRPCHSHPG